MPRRGQYKDLTDKSFGYWTVLKFSHQGKHGDAYWLCLCRCGTQRPVIRTSLLNGQSTSCGCRYDDLTGNHFGRFTVIGLNHQDQRGSYYWRCQCTCGTIKLVRTAHLRSGAIVSCGCLRQERLKVNSVTHGMSHRVPEYGIWQTMKWRCLNPNVPEYKNYGQRGITIDPAWYDFAVFYSDMGPRPTPDHTLERVNNVLGYSRENCIWATRLMQARNTRKNHFITYQGMTLCVSAWIEKLGCVISSGTVHWRLRHGWSPERAFTAPVRGQK